MNRLWNYEDYINHLSHRNRMVRRWAFATIENHYPNRYTDDVCNLIGDEDEHLACASPKYLAKYGAIQHAPAILESFKKGPADAYKSDYTDHAAWCKAVHELNQNTYTALLSRWRKKHNRRRNLWRDMKAIGLSV